MMGRLRERRRRREQGFVEARPSLLERFAGLSVGRRRRGVLRRWFLIVGWLIAAPGHLLRATGDLVRGAYFAAAGGVRFLEQRRLRHLLQGLPAVAAAVGAAGVALAAMEHEPGLVRTYRELGRQALNADRPEEARLYLERLFHLDGGEAETRLLLGLALEKIGRTQEAGDLIRGVADGDGGGNPRANAWVAARLLAEEQTLSNPDRRRELRRHLEAAERGLPADTNVKLGLVKLDLASGQPRRAAERLAAAAAIEPALSFDLARLLAATGQAEAARAAMQRAEECFRGRLDTAAEDHRTRLLLAESVLALGRPNEALAVLREGMALDPNGPCATAAARLHIAAYDRMASQPNRDYPALMRLLREALRYDPRLPEAAIRLASFGDPDGRQLPAGAPVVVDPDTEAEVTSVLEGLLATGEQPPAVHMALGLKASRRGESEESLWHFQRAYDLDPSLAGVANNLAWALSHRSNPDLGRALGLISQVLERWPDEPAYRDTRGEIYLRMGRWDEALRDLEFALPSMREEARLHHSLAEVYDRLGKPSLAARHRDEAARLDGLAGRSTSDTGTGIRLNQGKPEAS